MKKQYIQPQLLIVDVEHESMMLEMSLTGIAYEEVETDEEWGM